MLIIESPCDISPCFKVQLSSGFIELLESVFRVATTVRMPVPVSTCQRRPKIRFDTDQPWTPSERLMSRHSLQVRMIHALGRQCPCNVLVGLSITSTFVDIRPPDIRECQPCAYHIHNPVLENIACGHFLHRRNTYNCPWCLLCFARLPGALRGFLDFTAQPDSREQEESNAGADCARVVGPRGRQETRVAVVTRRHHGHGHRGLQVGPAAASGLARCALYNETAMATHPLRL